MIGQRSPPSRGRGSKPAKTGISCCDRGGRPPRGGVDRNRTNGVNIYRCATSPPSRGRGSKQRQLDPGNRRNLVAPLAGAWIETPNTPCPQRSRRSPPSRGRGSKPLQLPLDVTAPRVAPLAGAWIETFGAAFHPVYRQVAPLAGAWIETRSALTPATLPLVAPLAGAWIETLKVPSMR